MKKQMPKQLREQKENVVYLAIWLALFLMPVLSLYVRTLGDSPVTFRWAEVFSAWRICAVYLGVFVIHNFWLAPLLLQRHRRLLYAGTTACLLAVFIFFQCMHRPAMEPRQGGGPEQMERMGGPDRPDGPRGPRPPELADDSLARPQHKPEPRPLDQMRDGGPRGARPQEHQPPLVVGQGDVVSVIVVVLLLGMNLGVKLYFKSVRDAEEMAQLEKQNLQHQLEYLKYQINPHFFMNTLNNIHALVGIDPEKAKSTILELSKMMRYILHEGNKSLIPLQREIQFLGNYITIMRLRYTDKVDIRIDVPEAIPDREIPPLLLITFVENAFKHGVSYQHPSYIHVEMRFIGNRFYFGCSNSKHAESTAELGGVGLANVKQRLDLIYGDRYTLDISDGDTTYELKLDLPMDTPTNS